MCPHALQAPLSGAQRKQELLGGHMKGKEAASTLEARGLGVRHQQKPRLAVRVAGLIQSILSNNLSKPPTSLPGAHPCPGPLPFNSFTL